MNLAQAFMRIRDARLRQAIVALVRQLASSAEPELDGKSFVRH
jgi:hypothetical protein